MIKGSLFAMYVFYCICSICHTEPPDLISQNNFRFIYFSSFHPQFHNRGSKKQLLKFNGCPIRSHSIGLEKLRTVFVFALAHLEGPLAFFCSNGNYNDIPIKKRICGKMARCNAGFSMHGPATRICSKEGLWMPRQYTVCL